MPTATKPKPKTIRPRKPPVPVTLTLPVVEAFRALRAANVCASTDTARPLLTCVRIEVSKRVCTIVATDSYRLGFTSFAAPKSRAGSINLPGTLIRKAMKIVQRDKVAKLDGTLEIGVDYEAKTCWLELPGCKFDTAPITGDYPKWRELEPGADVPLGHDPEKLAFNPVYLSDLNPILREWQPAAENLPIRPSLYGPAKPAKFEFVDDKRRFTYLLMPVRIS